MSVLSILLLKLLAIATFSINLICSDSTHVGCIKSEREALLRFKHDVRDPSKRLASWTGDGDCCKWAGVICNNLTGHVLELHLRNPPLNKEPSEAEVEAYERSKLEGKMINPSFLDLKHLIHLDLSDNNFEGIHIPEFLGSMGTLRYLNLSASGFMGRIPHQLGNLSNLQYFDLSRRHSHSDLHADNIGWLSGLSLLKYLDLSYVDLSKVSDWLLVIDKLPSLAVLQLSSCELNHFPPLHVANFSSLAKFDLSRNLFDNSLIPNWVFGLANLVFLDLKSTNLLPGPIPAGLQNLTCLKHLDLSNNNFNSSLPDWLYKFNRLEYLSLRFNLFLQGTILDSVGNLTSMKELDLSYNSLEGKIPKSFGRLCNLKSIYLSSVILSQEISEILDIFSVCISDDLESLDLSSNQLSGHLTHQLGQFKNLQFLYLHYNSINGPIPFSLGTLSSLQFLDISYNKLNGTLSPIHFINMTRLMSFYASGNSMILKVDPDWVPPFQLVFLILGSCHLGSQFPSWIHSQKQLIELDLSNSGISETIPTWFWNSLLHVQFVNLSYNQIPGEIPNLYGYTNLEFLDLSSNNLSGPLPLISSRVIQLDLSNNTLSGSIFQFLCHGMNESRETRILNLRDNFLSGELPDCWVNWRSLVALNLDNNKFSGKLPISIGTLSRLESFHIHKNKFSGLVPVSLRNCAELVVLDFGENEFVGNLSTWIGENFTRMLVLNLHSNKFHGFLPIELCRLVSLHILDLAYNRLSGTIPRCISNFSAMVTVDNSRNSGSILYPDIPPNQFSEGEHLVIKGRADDYSSLLNLVRSVDLSYNNFSGEIPPEVTQLGALISLNLSHNTFTGRVPDNIGSMRLIESIDFSANQLSGEIPQSISNLTFLNHLNLSDNNLTGKIPLSTQLQSLEASSFSGNELCGPPLLENCSETVPAPNHESGNQDDNEAEVNWFYVSMAPGFVVGFWCVIGPLLLNRRWRYMYFRLLDSLGDKFSSVVRKCC